MAMFRCGGSYKKYLIKNGQKVACEVTLNPQHNQYPSSLTYEEDKILWSEMAYNGATVTITPNVNINGKTIFIKCKAQPTANQNNTATELSAYIVETNSGLAIANYDGVNIYSYECLNSNEINLFIESTGNNRYANMEIYDVWFE